MSVGVGCERAGFNDGQREKREKREERKVREERGERGGGDV